jgi:lipopolysaccharide export system protein LptA
MFDTGLLKLISLRYILVSILLTGLVVPAVAQKKVKLKHAKVAKGGRLPNGDRFERAIGEVVFTQNKTTIYCDSAHIFKKKNSLNAFGRVRITEGDSVTITGRKLEYDGNKKLAKLRGNVVFTKLGTATLHTDFLDYLRTSNVAYYYNGGKLVDSANVLTSNKGYYNVNNNLASFKKNVKVVNPDYTMYSDSLQYNSRTKLIYFVAKTDVVNKDSSTFIYEKGVHNTATKVSDIQQGVAESQDYTLKGDRYDLDAVRNIAKVRGNVVMTHKKEQIVIYGQSSDYFKNEGLTKVYDKAYIAKVTENNDTLFMRADTLVSVDNPDPTKRKLLAYHNVRIFKTDLQGIADSLEYRSSDSTIYFYKKPVLWSQGNQLTADSIRLLIKKNTINKIYLITNSFVISTDTLFNFNQIKGRNMTADILNSKINKVYVEGNGESIYFILDDKTNLLMGMNKIICSNIMIRFKEGKVNNLSFFVKPEANFIPPHELKKDELTLQGFSWKSKEKPRKEDVVPDLLASKTNQRN